MGRKIQQERLELKIRNVITLTKNEFNEDKLKVPVSIFLGSLNLS